MLSVTEYLNGLDATQRLICDRIIKAIRANLEGGIEKLYHGSPVWFIKDNPILGISIKQSKVALLFWSGQSFGEKGLRAVGKHKAAEIMIENEEDIDINKIEIWIKESKKMQWNYRDIVKNKGMLSQLL
jgi:hypothetical protein